MPLEYFLPLDIPDELLIYDSELSQLGVGSSGKLGALIVCLEKDQKQNKTIIREQYSKVPLFIQRALYLEETLPSMAYLFIMSPSGGILQGDRYRMDIKLKHNAIAHMTTQGATRLYRMDKNFATQMLNISLDSHCYFEYVPDQIIPYRNSRFYQSVNLTVHDFATMVYSETIVPGRMAMDEYFAYDVCYLKLIAKNNNGSLRFIDTALLQPKKNKLRKFGILDDFNILSNIYILTPSKYVKTLYEQINASLINSTKIRGGCSLMSDNSGITIRILGNSIDNIKAVTYTILGLCRQEILGAQFSGIRKK